MCRNITRIVVCASTINASFIIVYNLISIALTSNTKSAENKTNVKNVDRLDVYHDKMTAHDYKLQAKMSTVEMSGYHDCNIPSHTMPTSPKLYFLHVENPTIIIICYNSSYTTLPTHHLTAEKFIFFRYFCFLRHNCHT